MQAWKSRQLDSPLPSLTALQSLDTDRTDSGMSISTDFDDDFFDLDLYQKERSASFGGVTQYSQQFLHRKVTIAPYFNTSLETLDSGRTRASSTIFQIEGIETLQSTNQLSSLLLTSTTPLSCHQQETSLQSPEAVRKLLPSISSPLSSSSFSPSSATSSLTVAENLNAYHHQQHNLLPLQFHQLTFLQQQPPASFTPDSTSSSSSSSTASSLAEIPEDILMDMLVDQGAETSSSASTSTSSVSRFGTDSFMNTPDDVMMEDLEPVPRDRCNTWPMRRPQLEPSTQSPIIHEQIPEEEADLYGSNEQCGRLGGSSTNGSTAILNSPDGNSSHPTSFSSDFRMSESPDDVASGNSKKQTTRRNAWGNMSYAELITTAIMASPEKRLTLAQVYEWMVQNVPYFRDKGDSNSSAGWKNSIRHNLSLHSRFMRIQNEGAGKSSWWVINPEAKPGRNPRRTRDRATTIDTTTKAQLEKSRRGAKKRIKESRVAGLLGSVHSGLNGNSTAGSIQSIQHDLYDDDSLQGSFDSMPAFRPRTQSNLSVPGSSSRVSPAIGGDLYDDLDFPSWVGDTAAVPNIPSDIVDRTDQMRIDASTHLNGTQIKQEPKPIKTEPIAPPPSYHELNSVRGPCVQNPLLHNPIVPSTNFKPFRMPLPGTYGYQNGGSATGWLNATLASPLPGIQSCGVVAAQHSIASSSALPIDLENLTLPDQPLIDMDMDVDALIRHELSQAGGHHIQFDL